MHCAVCRTCVATDIQPHRHCEPCGVCVKASYEHCAECGKCFPATHPCFARERRRQKKRKGPAQVAGGAEDGEPGA